MLNFLTHILSDYSPSILAQFMKSDARTCKCVKCAKVQFWREICKHPTNVQIIVFIKNQPQLCKHFTLKCANNHICANILNVQTTTFVQTRRPQICKYVKIHQPLMCKHDAVKCAKVQFWREICKHPTNVQIIVFIKNHPQLCKHFTLKCANNHICANILNVPTTTFVQTRRPQICKYVKMHQPLMCKHDAVKFAKGQFLREMCNWHPTNVQIIVFIKNQFT